MTIPMRHAPVRPMNPEVLICVLTVPVLSGPGGEARPAPPVVEVYASMRPPVTTHSSGTCDEWSPTLAVVSRAGSGRGLSGAWEATRSAGRSERLARQGTVPRARAEAAAAIAEAARVAVAEIAIASALAEGDCLTARIAEMDLQRERAEMRASVASLLMTRDARPGPADLHEGPMFTLVHDGATAMRADVFEEDLLRLVSGQDVALAAAGPADACAEASRRGPSVFDLRARLRHAQGVDQHSSRVVQGVFLSAEIPLGRTDASAGLGVEAEASVERTVSVCPMRDDLPPRSSSISSNSR